MTISRGWVRWCVAGLAIVAMPACGRSTTGPSGAETLDLAGAWSGTLFQPGSGTRGTDMLATWMATQTGNSVSGSHTLSHPVLGVTLTGTLAGVLTGSQLSLTQVVARGDVPGFPDCSFTGTGSVTVTSRSISGILTTSFKSCEGFNMFANGSVPAELALQKQ